MLQGELSDVFIEFMLDGFGVLIILSVLFWILIHLLYERGYLGTWPPSRRIVRIFVWMLVLLPATTLFVFRGSLLIISIIVPPIEPQLMQIVDHLDFIDYLGIIVFAAFFFFRILRWCWRGYGTTGVIVTISVTFSATLAFSSLGIAAGLGTFLFEFGPRGWTAYSLYYFCCQRDLMKTKTKKDSDVFTVQGYTSIEVAMRSIYSVIVPLVKRIRTDHDDSALRIMQSVLQMNGELDRSLLLACKALGFNRMELNNASDPENASIVLQNVATNWGNFSRIDFGALILVIGSWIVSVTVSIWALAIGTIKVYFVPLFLTLMLPVGMIFILSLVNNQKPGREYDVAKRHDESFRFCQNEYDRRQKLDFFVLVFALVGTICAGILILIFGNPSLSTIVMTSVPVLCILTMVLVWNDKFMRGVRLSEEETLVILRKMLPDTISSEIEIDDSDLI